MTRLRSAVLLTVILLAPPALSEEVKISTSHPLRYAEYGDVTAEETFFSGSLSSGSISVLHGDINIGGDLDVILAGNTLFRVTPDAGPYLRDGLRVYPNGVVNIGSHTVSANPPRLKVHTVIWAGDLYATGDPANSPQTYGTLHGFIDPSVSNAHLQRKGQIASRLNGVTPFDANGVPTPGPLTYGKLRIDGKVVQIGPSYFESNTATSPWDVDRAFPTGSGVAATVLVGTDTVDPPALGVNESFLQIGDLTTPQNPAIDDPNTSIMPAAAGDLLQFSSRAYKHEIEPLSPAQRAATLETIASIDVVRYRFKVEPDDAKKRLGFIAEDLPEDIVSSSHKGIDFAEAYAYAAAALQELQARNKALRARIETLEARKAKRAGR